MTTDHRRVGILKNIKPLRYDSQQCPPQNYPPNIIHKNLDWWALRLSMLDNKYRDRQCPPYHSIQIYQGLPIKVNALQ